MKGSQKLTIQARKSSVAMKTNPQSQNSSGFEKLQTLKPLRESNYLKSINKQYNGQRTPLRGSIAKENNYQTLRQPSSDISLGKKDSSQLSMRRATIELSEEVDFERLLQSEIDHDNRHKKKVSNAMVHQQRKMLAVLTNEKKQSLVSSNKVDPNLNLYVINRKSQVVSQASKIDKKQRPPNKSIDQKRESLGGMSFSKSERLSSVESKVKKNLRAKTPKQIQGAVLTKQQTMDNQNKRTARHDQINELENQLQSILNGIEFKQSRKNLILESYKQANQADDQSNFNALRQSKKIQITSKRQFSEFEYLVQNHQFNEQNQDKVYLEICGFKDLEACKSGLLESQKQQNNKIYSPRSLKNILQAFNEDQQDITGSVTFFEKRSNLHSKLNGNQGLQPCQNQGYYLTFESFEQEKHNIPNQEVLETNLNSFHFEKELQSKQEENVIKDSQRESKVSKVQRIDVSYKPTPIFRAYLERQKDLKEENKKLEKDFETLFEEMNENRKTATHSVFYEALQEHDYESKADKIDKILPSLVNPESPTKRLIHMKNSTVDHLKQIKNSDIINMQRSSSQSHIYMASPDRAYVVQPNDQIDYNLAQKKPLLFQEQVLKGSVNKFKIQSQQKTVPTSPFSAKKNTVKPSISKKQFQHQQSLSQISIKKPRQKENEGFVIISQENTARTQSVSHMLQQTIQTINQKIKNQIEQKLVDKFGSKLTQQVLQALEEANLQEAFKDILQNSNQTESMFEPFNKQANVKTYRGQKTEKLVDQDQTGSRDGSQKGTGNRQQAIRVYQNDEGYQTRDSDYYA